MHTRATWGDRFRHVRRLDVVAFALGLAVGAGTGIYFGEGAAPEAVHDARPPVEQPVEEPPAGELPELDGPSHRAA